MSNPVLVVRTHTARWGDIDESRPAYRACWTWCPGCEQAHPFTVEIFNDYSDRPNGEQKPVWEWNGDEESPTFSPSLLCHYSVHLCPPEYVHYEECTAPAGECGRNGHAILNDDLSSHHIDQPDPSRRILGHHLPHVVDPAYGNCHSFLRNGVWEFLGDSAHHLAGQNVPMVPLPDYLL